MLFCDMLVQLLGPSHIFRFNWISVVIKPCACASTRLVLRLTDDLPRQSIVSAPVTKCQFCRWCDAGICVSNCRRTSGELCSCMHRNRTRWSLALDTRAQYCSIIAPEPSCPLSPTASDQRDNIIRDLFHKEHLVTSPFTSPAPRNLLRPHI